jgi:glutamate-1-semialdehyde aminotransferase
MSRNVQGKPGRRRDGTRLVVEHEPGIYMTPGREEEWTLSVTHTDEAIDAYVQAFDEMAAALTS